MTRNISYIILMVLMPLLSPVTFGSVVIYENDFAGWQAASSGASAVTTIDFDSISVPDNVSTAIAGNEFIALPGAPVLSVVDGELIVAEGANFFPGSFNPTSGLNVFGPRNSIPVNGVTRVDFGQSASAFGAWFLDVENGFAATGFDIDGNSSPSIQFSGDQGNLSQRFLGFVSDTPFTSVDIFFAQGVFDGVAIDDLSYTLSTVPEPNTILLLLLGFAVFPLISPRNRRRHLK